MIPQQYTCYSLAGRLSLFQLKVQISQRGYFRQNIWKAKGVYCCRLVITEKITASWRHPPSSRHPQVHPSQTLELPDSLSSPPLNSPSLNTQHTLHQPLYCVPVRQQEVHPWQTQLKLPQLHYWRVLQIFSKLNRWSLESPKPRLACGVGNRSCCLTWPKPTCLLVIKCTVGPILPTQGPQTHHRCQVWRFGVCFCKLP